MTKVDTETDGCSVFETINHLIAVFNPIETITAQLNIFMLQFQEICNNFMKCQKKARNLND